MSVLTGIYDLQFSAEERQEIGRLRSLDANRGSIAWSVGILICISVFLAQTLFHSVQLVHAICTYGALPAGLGVGYWLNARIDRYIENQFKSKWDLLYMERSGRSRAKIATTNEVNEILDRPEFYALPMEEQRRIMERMSEKRGLNWKEDDAQEDDAQVYSQARVAVVDLHERARSREAP
jgi:hypothetical protein